MSDSLEEFEKRSARFAAKTTALQEARKRVAEHTVVGNALGAICGACAWAVSDAPWWATPVFVLCCGWFVGKIFGGRKYRSVARILNAAYPELRLP